MSLHLQTSADSLVVIDFETTGLSPDLGDRAIEIGAVRLQNGVVTDRFQQLMNPGFRISGFIESYTGISNAMLMSITERFREIATMKCLGATDGFILKQFLIEAAIQGVVGGTAGMLIGMLISVVKSSAIFGAAVFAHGYEASVSSDEFQAITLGWPYGIFISGHTHRPTPGPPLRAMRTKAVPLDRWYLNAGCTTQMDRPYMERKRQMLWGHAVVYGWSRPIASPRFSRTWDAWCELIRPYE